MNTILKNCSKCSNIFDAYSKWGIKKFCSRKCSNSRKKTEEQKNKISQSVKNSPKSILARKNQKEKLIRISKICPVCQTNFLILPSNIKKIYCSRFCYLNDSEHKYRSQTTGGYRPGSGRAKTGYYKGIYCGSTYELVWVIYQLDHCINFERFPGFLEKDGVKYYPDFLQNGNIVEIKGYESKESVSKKTAVAESFGYSVLVLRKDDLKYCFDWVKKNYNYENLIELYDGYKPKYQYTCNHCGNLIKREKRSKTEINFCSRLCSGKGHKGRVSTENIKN